MTTVSVCMLGHNVRPYLEESLPIVKRQQGFEHVEILFADNESEDGSGDVAAEHGAQVVFVPDEEFHHALTRRMLTEKASGEFVCMLVGDATPCDEFWLTRLIEPLQNDPLVRMCFSRWLPRPDAPPVEMFDIIIAFPPKSAEAFIPRDDAIANAEFLKDPFPYIHSSNVSSAYRREQFLEIPFTKETAICEDQFAAHWFLRQQFKVRYCALSRAYHSHNEPPSAQRRRIRKCAAGLMHVCDVPVPSSSSLFRAIASSFLSAFGILRYTGAPWTKFWNVFTSRLARKMGERDAVRAAKRGAKKP